MTLRPYPAYKDPGVSWLGQGPVCWELRRMRHAVEMRVRHVVQHGNEGELLVRLCTVARLNAVYRAVRGRP